MHVLPCRHDQEHAEVDGTDRMISLQFSWSAEKKEVSSIWIGTSPEFEIALYTLCFVAGAEVFSCSLSLLQVLPSIHAGRNNPCPVCCSLS